MSIKKVSKLKVERRECILQLFWTLISSKPYNNFLKSVNAIIILMMEKCRKWLGELSNIQYCCQ